jgi:hypothetical protein
MTETQCDKEELLAIIDSMVKIIDEDQISLRYINGFHRDILDGLERINKFFNNPRTKTGKSLNKDIIKLDLFFDMLYSQKELAFVRLEKTGEIRKLCEDLLFCMTSAKSVDEIVKSWDYVLKKNGERGD